jgi:hypothetical protein
MREDKTGKEERNEEKMKKLKRRTCVNMPAK